jgi:hypothetical protein
MATSRGTTYGKVSTALALLSDRRLGELMDDARPLGSGIGGTAVLLDVEGTPVFVKRVPLTDPERSNARSTANTFDLPSFCQYGIGGPGFGVWRELAVHTMTTNWVLDDQSPSFPLMYHHRAVPDASPSLPEELRDIEKVVEYWEGSPAVRDRLEALEQASSSILLFLEYVPQTLHDWLNAELAKGGEAAESACTFVERTLATGVAFMNSHGLLHFDAHFQNILTDGERLYFADFGLAMCDRFDYSPAESAFFEQHLSYDRCYTTTQLVLWLVTALYGYDKAARNAFIRECAEGTEPADIPKSAAAIIARHAPMAVVMSEFFGKLQNESRNAPYPVEEIAAVR